MLNPSQSLSMTEVSTVLEPTTNTSQEPIPVPAYTPDTTPINPDRRDKQTRITVDTAKAMLERRRQVRLERAQKQAEDKARAQSNADINPDKTLPDPFVLSTLAKVREQIDRLQVMLASESEPSLIDKLCSSLSRLSDIEQKLSGRPSPGSLRPTDKPSQGRASLLLGSSGPGPSRGKVEQE